MTIIINPTHALKAQACNAHIYGKFYTTVYAHSNTLTRSMRTKTNGPSLIFIVQHLLVPEMLQHGWFASHQADQDV